MDTEDIYLFVYYFVRLLLYLRFKMTFVYGVIIGTYWVPLE